MNCFGKIGVLTLSLWAGLLLGLVVLDLLAMRLLARHVLGFAGLHPSPRMVRTIQGLG